MNEKTNLMNPDLIDLEELKRLEKEALDRLLNKPIQADNTMDFLTKMGEKQLIRKASAPETLHTNIPSPNKYPLESLPELPESSRLASELPDSNPMGTKTLHRSTDMVDQEAIDYVNELRKSGQNKLKSSQLPSPPSFLNQDVGAKTLHKSSNMASQEAIDYATNLRKAGLKRLGKSASKTATATGVGATYGGVPGAILGLLTSIGSEIVAPEELGPEAGSDEEIIENPNQPLEVRKAAMMRMKNKYLKPQE